VKGTHLLLGTFPPRSPFLGSGATPSNLNQQERKEQLISQVLETILGPCEHK
jgi:hypothetical protein